MFSPNVGKSKRSYVLLEMAYCYDLQKPETFGARHRTLRDIGSELFKTFKTGTNACISLPVFTVSEQSCLML
jgi:hypothetical protein